MAATKTTDRSLDVQVLVETVQGAFAQKDALMGSVLVQQGAISVDGQMPHHGPEFIGNTVQVPYFGVIGDFADNAEDTAATPVVLKSTHETATIGRSSLAFEATRWARHSHPNDSDPYEECARQIVKAAQREMDRLCITAAAATPLVLDRYSSGTPVYLDYDFVVDGRSKWGDDEEDIVAMVVHSRAMGDLRKLKSADGLPLLIDSQKDAQVPRLCGIPIVVSDRMPLTGSSMGSVTETGAAVGGVGLTGTPTGPWNLQIRIILGGARGTATFQFSTDGGNTWSATLTTAATVVLTDTATDSLVGNNGATGLTATFGVATYDVLSVYSATALLKSTSLIFQRGALAFWYNRAAMGLETDKDILKHNDVAAMHMYRAAHLYRRRRGGPRPGVVALKHNLRNYLGV